MPELADRIDAAMSAIIARPRGDALARARSWRETLKPWGTACRDVRVVDTPLDLHAVSQRFAETLAPVASALGRAKGARLDAAFAEGARLAYAAAERAGCGTSVWGLVSAAADVAAYAARWEAAEQEGLVVAGYSATPAPTPLAAWSMPFDELRSPYAAALDLIAAGAWLLDSRDSLIVGWLSSAD